MFFSYFYEIQLRLLLVNHLLDCQHYLPIFFGSFSFSSTKTKHVIRDRDLEIEKKDLQLNTEIKYKDQNVWSLLDIHICDQKAFQFLTKIKFCNQKKSGF